jgi:PPM family protein phosphatase
MTTESIRFFAATDVGRVRDHNEDNFLVDKKLGLFIVADGMGGHAAGEVASAAAVRAVHEEVKREITLIEDFSKGARGSARVTASDLASMMEQAVHKACAKVYEMAVADVAKRGMGTTLTALLVVGQTGVIAHVGDSRCYLVREDHAQQVTEDHTVYNELIRKGKLTQDQIAKIGSKKNALMRAVGVYERVDVDTLVLELLPGDALLLASDGLTQYLASAEELVSVNAEAEGDLATKKLIQIANERGGSDNITVVLVRVFGDSPEAEARAQRLALKRDILAKVPIFARLSERELLRVMQVAEPQEFAEGETLVREKEKGEQLFVILSGGVSVSRGGSVLTHLGQGENFGEMALIRSALRSATVTADVATSVLCIHRRDFFDILRREHEIGIKMLWQFLGVLADRLDQTSGELRTAREELEAEELEALPDSDSDDDGFSLFAGPETTRGR